MIDAVFLQVVVPGSQRATRPLPHSIIVGESMVGVERVPMKAGDVRPALFSARNANSDTEGWLRRWQVLLFLGNAVTHGAQPWSSDRPRRVAMLDYLSAHVALGRL